MTSSTDDRIITLSIVVQGANDAPRDIAISSGSVDENVPNGTVVGTLTAFDPDGNPITWTLTDSAGGRFALDPNTGVLTILEAPFPPNYEGRQSYTIRVTASDGTLQSAVQELTISINDVDEAPFLLALQNKLPVPIPENALAAETLYYTLTVHDDALGSWTTSLSGAQANLFHLRQTSPTEYKLYFNGGVVPDYETLQGYAVSVDVDDPAMGDGPEARFNLTVPVANVEEPSTTSSVTITVDEDTPRILTSADFPCADPDGVGMLRVEILTVPAKGKLYYDPTGGNPSDAILLTGMRTVTKAALDAGQLWYVADKDEHGPAYASFLFQVADAAGLTNIATMSFAVNRVNDAPQWSGVPQVVPYHEGKTITFAPQVTISDAELDALNGGLGNYAPGTVVFLQRSSGFHPEDVFGLDLTGASFTLVGNTLMTLAGDPFGEFSSWLGKMTLGFGGQTAPRALVNEVLQRLTYTNTSDNPPEGGAEFRWKVFDGNYGAQGSGGEQSAVATTQLDFRPENDAPVNHVPGVQIAGQATDLGFGAAQGNAITISDVDAGDGVIIVRLRVEHGTLTLGATGGLTAVTGNGSAVLEFRGELGDVNAALDGLIYRASAGYAGSDTLRVFTDDHGNTGSGGNERDTDDVAIFVTPTSHPTVAADDSVTTAEDNPVTIAVTANDSDPDGLPGVFAINGASIAPGGTIAVANGSVTLNIDGTLTFTPTANFNGTTSFSYLAGTGLRYQFFDRTDANPFTSVTQIPLTGGIEGVAPSFDVTALATDLSGDADHFGVRYTGAINIATGGSYTFYTVSDDGSALYIDGVLVVDNDLLHGPAEVFGTVTLAAGTHAIEIRYFEYAASEVLQVSVSGPDTADVKRPLLESALLGADTANVEITVNAVNDAPQIASLAPTVTAVEQTPVLLAPNATVSDAELDALNGGAGLYTGAKFTFSRTSNGGGEDRYGFDTTGALFTFEGGVLGTLKSGGATFANVLNAPGVLIITFDSAETPATTALVNDVLRHVTFTNTSDSPPSQVELVFQLSEGNVGQSGGAAVGRLVTVQIAPVDDPTTMTGDSASTVEDRPVTIAVLGNDHDPDTLLAISAVNGTPIAVGGSVTVANGSVTLNSDGTLTFTPTTNFNGTASFDYAARTGLHFQLFDRTGAQSFFRSVTEIPTAGGVGGTATDFDVAALASSLTGDTDNFAVRYTGTINVAAGGSYTFYTTSDDGSALYIDGVMVVNNDFSQGATERSGSVTLTAGTHAIEIRYFEGGGGEQLQVHVSGPDTADLKTGLFDSPLLTLSATVDVTVSAVNDGPRIANLADTLAAVEQTAVLVSPNATVSDPELDALNGGAGLYTGTMLRVLRAGRVGEDEFGFDTTGALFTVSGNTIKFGAATFATFSESGGILTIKFTSTETAATTALVSDVMRHITYTNTSDTPPARVVLSYGFGDGNFNDTQGSGGQGSTVRAITVELAPVDDPTVLTDDNVSTAEDTPVGIAVLGNDSDPDTPLAVSAVNGTPISAGNPVAVAVANGNVTLNADGTLTFTPAANFNGTASFDYTAKAGLHFQLFDRSGEQSFFHSVTEIPTAGGVGGTATDFDVAALASSLTGDTDNFAIRYTGMINVAAGGTYTFYTASDDGSALYIDGVLVVNNDFSQGATERSGTVMLAAGTHAIEIRYFEGGGGESLQVQVSGPDTSDVKTDLFDSSLMTFTAAVNVDVTAANDPPQLINLNSAVNALEQTGVIVNSGVTVFDADLDALNGGAGLYTGASLMVVREGGASAEDVFLLDAAGALFTIDGNDLKSGGVTFATFDNSGGTLIITFTSAETAATSALVNDVMRHIVYLNTNDNPAAPVALSYTFHDGSPGNGQGDGAQATATGTMTINVAPIDDETVTEVDLARTAEDRPVVIDVLANDTDVDSLLVVTEIDGQPIVVNGWVTVANGNVMLNADNKLTFMPASNFNGETSFTYKLNTGFAATVTVMVDPVEDPTVVTGDHHAVVAEGGTVTLTIADLTAVDADVSDEQLVYSVTSVAHGVVMLNGTETGTFTQADLAAGRVALQHDAGEEDGSIVLSLTGGGAAAQSITIEIQVDPHGNDAPVAQDGSASGDEDTVITGTAVASDVDDTQLTFSLVGPNGGAQHGSVTMNADGSYSYTPVAEFSGTDRFFFIVTDPDGVSSSAEVGVTVNDVKDPPGGGAQGAPILYAENQAAAAIDPALTVTDPDSADLTGARVAILAGFAVGQDVLGFADQNGITGSYDAASGVLTLTGTASLAAYQAALRSVTYFNGSDDPSAAARAVNFQVDDGGGLVSLGDTNVTVVPANDGPTNAMPASFEVEANTNVALGGLSIADIDAGNGAITTTLSVGHGTLTVASGVTVLGNGTATVELTGTLAQINAAVAGNVTYRGALDFFGTDTLTIVTNDGGNSGTGGALADTDTVTINVNTLLTGTRGNDSYAALPGNERIDAGGGIDTVTFDFRLVDATVTYQGNTIIIDSASSHTVLTGFERFVFTDGTVDNDDRSPLVDDLFYYARYHDVWTAHVDADAHYDLVGWHESRDPSAFFSTLIYLSANPDVKAAGTNPLMHFDIVGWQEGRVPSLTFDPAQYLAANPDVAAAKIDPLAHFLGIGASEGRQPFAPSELVTANGFDYVYYLSHNPDVAAAHVDPLWHFQNIGWKEGRDPNALFDTAGYLATYADVAAANINPLDHYALVGWHEGRDPSVGFDTSAYLAAYPDVAAANVDPLQHYLAFGIHEGRSPQADGLWG
jgi:hypothetical protein